MITLIKLFIEKDKDGLTNPIRIEYPDGTIVYFKNGRLDLSKCREYIGEPIEVYDKGKLSMKGVIQNYDFLKDQNEFGINIK